MNFKQLFVLLFTCICLFQFGSAVVYNQPKLLSSDGNLLIVAAENRNISLETRGKGYVNINGVNLVRITQMAFNASRTVQRIRVGILQSMESSINRISDVIEGPHGLVKRVSFLEVGGNGSAFIPSGSGSYQPIPINRRLNALRRRLIRLESSVSFITRTLNQDECSSNPCKNGGTCQDLFADFMCLCPDNWQGPLCDKDVNECANFAGTDLGCQNGATCVNKPGTYECTCPAGWYGIHCTKKTADCVTGSSQELCGHGICVSQQNANGYSCICDQGWKTDGIRPACIVDVDECAGRTPPCSVVPAVPCINVPGSFYCGSCPAGYTGNGHYCADIDECLQPNNGGCSINPKVQCINTLGSRICGACPPGYIGDGVTCSYAGGACQVGNGGCHYLARCVENSQISSTYVRCLCPPGYTGHGFGSNGCTRDSSVPDQLSNACLSNPCVQGTCQPTAAGFICHCTGGFSGTHCNIPNPCSSNPCLNGGTCTAIESGDFRCACTRTYYGKRCHIERQSCGGYLRTETGVLRYPTNNSTYNNRISCGWTIQTNESLVLNLTFSKFHVEETTDCLFDWLQIHDGKNSAARMIGRFCGSKFPLGGTIVSTHNNIYLWFRSDHSVSGSGFVLSWKSVEPTCGAVIETSSHGTLQSPGSPGNYPPNRDCSWLIFAPAGKRIQIHFFTMMLGNNPNCSFDYLKIYTSDDSILAEYCNTSHPEPLLTSGSETMIHFHSDGNGTDAGFQLTYSVAEGYPGCGGLYNREKGEIHSPVEDGSYPSNLECEYKIKLMPKSKIKIMFLQMSLEDSTSCKFDHVLIRDGLKSDSPLIGTYCGEELPPVIYSTGNEVSINFKSDWSTEGEGFRLKYEMLCGETYTDKNGVIQSPGYPDSYSSNRNCIFKIHRPAGSVILLTFIDFDIEGAEDCDYDYIEIRDGDSDTSNLVGRYCGESDQIPPPITSTHNDLYISFVTDDSVSSTGFLANYTSIDLGCGGIFRETVGFIQTPKDLNNYPANKECIWKIMAPIGFAIELSWMSFNLESSRNCSADYVEIYDSSETNINNYAGRYCGQKPPPTLMSSSNVFTIVFSSDSSRSAEGFMASYRFIDESTICGGTYSTTSGTIRSPGYPKNYPQERDCVWLIRVSSGQQVFLNISEFDIEKHQQCKFDSLEIRNGGHYNSPLIGTYCGTDIPKSLYSFTNEIYLRFRSDRSRSGKGFLINWDGTTTGCGGVLTSFTGHIMSPNYPQPYNGNSICFWKITISAGSIIQIIFADIEMESQPGCHFDYVVLYNGLSVTNNPVGRYCSEKQTSTIIRSNTNKMLVKFRSDLSHEGRGFNLKYITVCNHIISGYYHGIIESPNFPNPYPDELDCTWVISVPMGNKINVTFSHLDTESNKNTNNTVTCEYDYIEIKEGEDNQTATTSVGKYCGNTIPNPFTSTTNNVFITFKSDELRVATGFRLEWIIHGCGGHLTHPDGKISTPGYPKKYPSSTVCEWSIEVDYTHSIELNITHVDMESSSDCQFDSLIVYGGPDDTSPKLSNLCHVSKDNIILTSSGNKMFIKFTSDASFSGKGFQAVYKSVPIRCGGRMIALSGMITSRNYPKNYDNNDDCAWIIEVPAIYLIELTFEDFDIESYRNCSGDYVKVYDGKDSDAPILMTHCGNTLPSPSTIISSGNVLFIRMKSDGFFSAKGFKANYTLACGRKIVTDSFGILNIKTDANHRENCSWIIESATPGNRISLTITYLDSNSCFFDNNGLCIYDGDTPESQIGCYCESKTPPTITSDSSALTILITEGEIEFVATYSIFGTKCGGELTGFEGSFASVGYPKNYPMNSSCEWKITASEGNRVTVTFSNFELEPSDNGKCNEDFVEIREGSSVGPLLGVFCGNTVPDTLNITKSIWIHFKSNGEGTAKGFLADYTLVHGNDLYGSQGKIQSPLYPKSYTKGDDMEWRITVEFGKVILIKFNDFYMYNWDSSEECYYFKLEIFDGYDSSAPSILNVCGSELPTPVKSTSNVVFIKYSPMVMSEGSRFDLEWLAVNKIRNTTTEKPPTEDGCGSNEVIDISMGRNYSLISPGYPHGYKKKMNCEWIFSTNENASLRIFFSEINIEVTENCLIDSIDVYTGIDGLNVWEKVNSVCARNSTYASGIKTSNLMKVVFRTNPYTNKTGFSARIFPECGSSIKSSFGVLELTNQSIRDYRVQRYRPSVLSCSWNITARTGKKIQIKFERFEMAPSLDNSCENYILIKNGKYDDSPLLGSGKYCGNTIPTIPLSTGNAVSLKYFGNSRSKGFKLIYEEFSLSCGKEIRLSNEFKQTIISSPNYPNIPEPFTECIWTIIAPADKAIRLDFIDRFDLFNSKDCTKEGVELRDGATRNSKLIGTFCATKPSSQRSTGNYMFVRFYTNITDPKNGFKANVLIATCGGFIRSSTGRIQSPNYPEPGSIMADTTCFWNIVGPINHALTLTLNPVHLPMSRNCSSVAHINIFEQNVFNDTDRLLTTICGMKDNQTIEVSTNRAYITFTSSGKNWASFKGFSILFNSTKDVCGGSLQGPGGIFSSPGYPLSKDRNRHCEWTIEVPKGRIITIEFLDIDFVNTADSYDQGLAFFNEKNYRSHIVYIQKSDIKQIIKSTWHIMTVYYWSGRGSSHHRGFKARYTSNEPAVCEGDFNTPSGIIQTSEKLTNLSTYYCEWDHIITSADKYFMNHTFALVIDVKNISDQSGHKCGHSSSSIIVSDVSKENILRELCGQYSEPILIRSPFPTTKITAVKGKSTKYPVPFNVNFTTYPCGGILTGSDLSISSPGYPDSYLPNMECAWLIKAGEGEIIKVLFETLDMNPSCEHHFINIHNGPTPNSPLIGRYCGNNKPENVHSEQNSLWIDYHSGSAESNNKRKGFKLSFSSDSSGCGGIYHDAKKVISSPNFPQPYPNDAECVWEVRALNGYFISLEFIDRFQLEDSTDCINDFVEVWDYHDEVWESMGRSCGRNPEQYNSTSDRLKIMFRSNSQVNGIGFKAKWHLNCGGIFKPTGKENIIHSPGYPVQYEKKMFCNYTLLAPGKYINMVFTDFVLEKGTPECRYDNVTIKGKFRQYGTYCGTEGPSALRIKDYIYIIFQTDMSVFRKGFVFKYYTDVCGGNVTTPSEISSPRIFVKEKNQYLYYSSMKCTWNITAPKGQVIVLRFSSLDLEYNSKCIFDSVGIYDGLTLNRSSRLALLCGKNYFPVIKSTTNQMTLYMKTDLSNNFGGFKAYVLFSYGESVGCGGTITLSESNKKVEINSPRINGSQTYVPFLDCHWLVSAPFGNNIKITFSSFHVSHCDSNSTSCDCDFVQVRDGAGPLSELMLQHCGHTIPIPTTSSGHNLWLRFSTDGSTPAPSTGFKANVELVTSLCGKTILNVTNQTQSLTSPNYPSSYPANIKCTWLLIGDSKYRKFDIHFEFLELEEPDSNGLCVNDKLQISDKTDSSIISEGIGSDFIFPGARFSMQKTPIFIGSRLPTTHHIFCGSGKPLDYYTNSQSTTIQFYTNNQNQYKGFKINYSLAGCSRNFTGVQGRILNEDLHDECYITITAPANHTISLYFQSFLLYDSVDCSTSVLKITDGKKNATELAKLCGYQNPSPVFSKTNYLFLYARNSRVPMKGIYDIIYTTTDKGQGCGGQLYNYGGIFSSPLYPGNYRFTKTCRWDVSTPKGTVVVLKFQKFDLGSKRLCDTDYVQLFDVNLDTGEETLTTRYCGDQNPAIFQSRSNVMAVVYNTSPNNGGNGWLAAFMAKRPEQNVANW